MRLGILGGTFDPVHLGHLRMALETAEELTLDRMCLVPSSMPPHKGGTAEASFADRTAMARIAVRGAPLLDVLDLEGRRRGVSYTILTLRELHDEYPGGLELYFVVGTDAFFEIGTWKEYRSLFDYAHFVLIDRPGVSPGVLEPFIQDLDIGAIRTAPGVFRVGNSGNSLIRRQGTFMGVSSTQVRDAVARGKSIRFLVPEEVERYIIEKGLYLSHGES
ncbi:MAG: nicotinate-nucleotide adenylyltransferase [Thermodesulfobacteriota bacterium]